MLDGRTAWSYNPDPRPGGRRTTWLAGAKLAAGAGPLFGPLVHAAVAAVAGDLALEEDVGRGDVTARRGSTNPGGGGRHHPPASGWWCRPGRRRGGLHAVRLAHRACAWKVADGNSVAPTTTVATVRGPAAAFWPVSGRRSISCGALSGIDDLDPDFVGAVEGAKRASPTRARPCPARRAGDVRRRRIGEWRQPPRESLVGDA